VLVRNLTVPSPFREVKIGMPLMAFLCITDPSPSGRGLA
jgi:hypothetical protein